MDRSCTRAKEEVVKKYPIVHWWNKDCQNFKIQRIEATKVYKTIPNQETWITYKKAIAQAKKSYISAKRQSWAKYCEDINNKQSISTVWAKFKSIGKPHTPRLIPLKETWKDEFIMKVTCNNKHEPADPLMKFSLSVLKIDIHKDYTPIS